MDNYKLDAAVWMELIDRVLMRAARKILRSLVLTPEEYRNAMQVFKHPTITEKGFGDLYYQLNQRETMKRSGNPELVDAMMALRQIYLNPTAKNEIYFAIGNPDQKFTAPVLKDNPTAADQLVAAVIQLSQNPGAVSMAQYRIDKRAEQDLKQALDREEEAEKLPPIQRGLYELVKAWKRSRAA